MKEVHQQTYHRRRRIRVGRIIAVAIIIIVIVILVIAFSDWRNGRKEQPQPPNIVELGADASDSINPNQILADQEAERTSNPDTVWGIDVSHWQQGIITPEWIRSLKPAGCRFVYIQFGGTDVNGNIVDKTELTIEWANICEAEGMAFGFYFRTDAKTETEQLASEGFILKFLKKIEGEGWRNHLLPVMIDHEVLPNEKSADWQARLSALSAIVADLELFGLNPIVYSSSSALPEMKKHLPSTQQYWIAEYLAGCQEPPKGFKYPESEIVIWQYTNNDDTIKERSIDVSLTPGSGRQEQLDRNLMRWDFYSQFVPTK